VPLTLTLSPLREERNGERGQTVRVAVIRAMSIAVPTLSRAAIPADQKKIAAFFSVIQTPQHSGMPTKAQKIPTCASSPPLPMPNEPVAV
jgi:hypothetical protein